MTGMMENRGVVTNIDFDRLRQLATSQRYRMTHSALLAGLDDELQRCRLVTPDLVPRGVVTMNSRVRVRDLKSGETETYTLVYPESANIREEKLSVLAPLGRALLGRRKGQTVTVDAPAGRRRLKVERILYQPEAAGDFHL